MNNKLGLAAIASLLLSQGAMAACSDVSSSDLLGAVPASSVVTGGYGLPMWITFVDETGKVCAVVTNGTTGAAAGNSEWLGSRIISAQKANTANDFSIDGYAISTANLYSAVQPGGSLYGLQHSNPVDPEAAYHGDPVNYGTNSDPIIGKRIGGVNVFGGGLALYKAGKKIGAIGVSGDTSCRDHAFAWQVRNNLGLHPASPTAGITTSNIDAFGKVQKPLSGAIYGDELIINASSEKEAGYWAAWSQPACPGSLGHTASQNAANGTIILNKK